MASGPSGIEKRYRSREARKEFEVERLLLEVSEQIELLLEDRGWTRADLARALGVTPARVSQLLGGTANMTLKTLAEILFALDHRVERLLVRKLPPAVTKGARKEAARTRSCGRVASGAARGSTRAGSSRR